MTLSRNILFSLILTASAAAQSPDHPFRLDPPKSVFVPTPQPGTVPHLARSVVVADLDGDGAVDLARPTLHGPEVQLRRGARFEVAPQATALSPGLWMVAGDVDGDGDPDLMESGAGQFRLWLNDGVAGFADAVAGQVGPSQLPIDNACELVDLDGDGDLDLVSDMATVMINDGRGWFANETDARIPAFGFTLQGTLAVLDLEGDGDADFITLAGVFRNDGSGTFAHEPGLPIGYGDQLLPCDMDRDGDTDLLSRGGELLFVNDGQGAFSQATTAARLVLAVADLDGDGWVDGLATNPLDRTAVQIYWGSALGFGVPVVESVEANLGNAGTLTPADLNGDGKLDILVTMGQFGEPAPPLALFHDGRRGFLPGHALSIVGSAVRTAEAAVFDANGDGAPDLVGTYAMLTNDGTGRLHSVPHGGDALVTVHGDWDGDGDEDYLSAFQGALYWVINDGRGGFSYDRSLPPLPVSTTANGRITAESLDWDNDGDIDLVTLADEFLLWTNDGTGALQASTLFPVVSGVGGVTFEFADFDRDGRRDVALALTSPANQSGVDLGILMQQSGGGFTLRGSVMYPYVSRLAIGDLNGDGHLDVLASGLSALPHLLAGNGRGGFLEQSTNLPAGALYVSDVDLDGDLDVAARGAQPILWANDGSGQFTQLNDLAELGAPPRTFSDTILFVDLDGDGDEDMLHGGTSRSWNSSYNTLVYWNDSRHVRVPGATVLGGSLSVEIGTSAARAQAEPALTAWAWVDQVGRPTSIPGLGTVRIDPATAIFVGSAPVGAGSVELAVPIPTAPALVGQGLFVQGVLWGSAGLELTGFTTDWIVN